MNRLVQKRCLPFLGKKKSGLFLKGYNSPSDFVKETKNARKEVERLTSLAIGSNDENVVENIDNLSNRLCLTGKFNTSFKRFLRVEVLSFSAIFRFLRKTTNKIPDRLFMFHKNCNQF